MRCSVASWSWNVDDRATSTSGSSPGGGVHPVPAPRRVVEHRTDVAGVGRAAGRGSRSRATSSRGAAGRRWAWSMKCRTGASPQLAADGVEPVAALVPHVLHHGRAVSRSRARPSGPRAGLDARARSASCPATGAGRCSASARRTGCRPPRPPPSPRRRTASRRTRSGRRSAIAAVDVGEVAAEPDRRTAVSSRRSNSLQRVGALPVPVRIVLGTPVGAVRRLDPPAERGARRHARRPPSSPRRGR